MVKQDSRHAQLISRLAYLYQFQKSKAILQKGEFLNDFLLEIPDSELEKLIFESQLPYIEAVCFLRKNEAVRHYWDEFLNGIRSWAAQHQEPQVLRELDEGLAKASQAILTSQDPKVRFYHEELKPLHFLFSPEGKNFKTTIGTRILLKSIENGGSESLDWFHRECKFVVLPKILELRDQLEFEQKLGQTDTAADTKTDTEKKNRKKRLPNAEAGAAGIFVRKSLRSDSTKNRKEALKEWAESLDWKWNGKKISLGSISRILQDNPDLWKDTADK